MHKPKIITLILMTAALFTLSAQDSLLSFDEMTSFLSRDQKTQLLNEGELTEFHFASFDPLLLPPSSLKDELRLMVAEGELNMGIEGLFLYRDFDQESYRSNPAAVQLKMYNALRAVSSLEGTEYYSASRGEMRELFVESWMIPDLESPKEKMDDPLVSTIPDRDSFYIHQKDRSFGKHESEMEFIYNSPVIWSVIVNQTPMYYKGFLKVIKPGNMQIHLMVIPTDQGLLFYGISAADTLSIKAFREKANKSFYNRVKALYAWYTGKI